MTWRFEFSSNSLKFFKKNNIEETFAINKIKLALKKLKGENINVDIKKLSGKWEGFYRIRSGKLRIIIEFNFKEHRVRIEEVDWRGNVYK